MRTATASSTVLPRFFRLCHGGFQLARMSREEVDPPTRPILGQVSHLVCGGRQLADEFKGHHVAWLQFARDPPLSCVPPDNYEVTQIEDLDRSSSPFVVQLLPLLRKLYPLCYLSARSLKIFHAIFIRVPLWRHRH